MDLLRRQRQRGVLLDHRLVVRLPVRHRRRRQRRPRLGHVLAANHRQQPRVRRRDGVAEQRFRLGAHRRLVGGGDRRWHLRERTVERVGRVALRVRLDRFVAPGGRHARDGKAPRQAGSHVGDLLVEVARRVAEPAEIGAICLDGREALAGREVAPEERVAVERRFVVLELHVVGEGADRRAEDLRVDLLLGRQLVERDAVERRQRLGPVRSRACCDAASTFGKWSLSPASPG